MQVAQLPPTTPGEQQAAAKASSERNDGRPLLTIEQAAEFLGFSARTVYRIVKDGKLRAVKIEGSLRVRPSDIDDYVDRQFGS